MSVNVKFYVTVGLIGLIAVVGAYIGSASANDQRVSYIMKKPDMHMTVFAQGRSFEDACAVAKATRSDAVTIEVAFDNLTYKMCE